ncbi:hypothetical protein KY331_00175 [Candidatus Woesearchaeota archaeon]|nr:hypothetical protein [Candidatus Woesearchaeota archaeon]
MDISSIITIIVVLIIILAIFKIFKSVFKTIFLISTLFGIVMLVFMIILYQDVADFKTNFPTSEKLFLLEREGGLIAGFSGVLGEEEQPNFVPSAELNSYQISFEADDLEPIKGNYYKLFIVVSETFDEITSIEFGEEQLSKNFVFDLLDSQTSIDDYASYYAQSQGISTAAIGEVKSQMRSQFSSDAEFKGALFATLFSAKTQEDRLFLFKEYKKDNILIYPETMLFRTIKKIPLIFMQRFVKVENGNA